MIIYISVQQNIEFPVVYKVKYEKKVFDNYLYNYCFCGWWHHLQSKGELYKARKIGKKI